MAGTFAVPDQQGFGPPHRWGRGVGAQGASGHAANDGLERAVFVELRQLHAFAAQPVQQALKSFSAPARRLWEVTLMGRHPVTTSTNRLTREQPA